MSDCDTLFNDRQDQEQIAMLQNRLAEEKAKKGKTPFKREVSPISVPAAWTNEVIDLT